MTFQAALALAVAGISAGGACGCIISGCVLHSRRQAAFRSRFTAVCILLSVFIADLAAALIFIPDFLSSFPLPLAGRLYCAGIFAAGIFCAVFFRAAVPVFFVLYTIVSVFIALRFRTEYRPLPQTYTVSKSAAGLAVNGIPLTGGASELNLTVCTLPAMLLVPLPRVWVRPAGGQVEPAAGTHFRLPAAVDRWLTAEARQETVIIPEEQLLPAQYAVVCTDRGGLFYAQIKRVL